MQKLVILGTGSLAPEIADWAEETGAYVVTAFVDNRERGDERGPLLDRPIIGMAEAAKLTTTHQALCALGTTHRRAFVEQVASLGFSFATIIHPGARLSAKISVGEGSILSVGVSVGGRTTIGRHVLIIRGSLIGHHTNIGDYVTIASGVNIAGSVTIGEGTYVGMSAIVLDHLSIGAHAVIGAGAVVTRDVPDRVQVVGIPARITKENIEGM